MNVCDCEGAFKLPITDMIQMKFENFEKQFSLICPYCSISVTIRDMHDHLGDDYSTSYKHHWLQRTICVYFLIMLAFTKMSWIEVEKVVRLEPAFPEDLMCSFLIFNVDTAHRETIKERFDQKVRVKNFGSYEDV